MQRYRQHLWAMHNRRSKLLARQKEEFNKGIKNILDNSDTRKVSDSEFPNVWSYINKKFPDVDLSGLKVYISSDEVIQQNGWPQIGGCYIREIDTILVKDNMNFTQKNPSKFYRLMDQLCSMKIDVEDVLVHEIVHAVSAKLNRASCKFQHMEEEFVYTNCIDFYTQKGMTEEDIVNNNLLPFCINDVYLSRSDMCDIFSQSGLSIEDVECLNKDEFDEFCSKHANILAPIIKNKAQQKGHQMIELYRKYGCRMNITSEIPAIKDSSTLRFSSLDLEEL